MALRVFLADDDPSYRFLLREALPDDDIAIVGETGDPRAVVGAVAVASPDVVLLDRFCDAETVDQIRIVAPRTRVIVLSGHPPEHGDQAIVDAADGYLVKGADLEELRAAVRG